MTENGISQIIVYLVVVLAFVAPLGWYMFRVYEDKPCGLNQWFKPLENLFYKLCGIKAEKEMTWKAYLSAMLIFNFLGFLVLYFIFRLQAYLPLNPQKFANVDSYLSFNTAISFITNTNWQAYGGENTLSYFSQAVGLTVQNFLSAATGLALSVAFIRGIIRQQTCYLGNFWVDLTRSVLYILLPLSLLLAALLTSQGVIQNFKSYEKVQLLEHGSRQVQVLPMGPVASQVAIKQLGSNGGGFFNVNAAHPFENPTILSNFLEMISILLIPAALCYTFGLMVKDRRQGMALLITMCFLFIPCIFIAFQAEQAGNPMFKALHIDQTAKNKIFPGGNMEGKESRFGIATSALWISATTTTSNGSVNAMADSFMPIGGLMPLWLMHLGEVAFGGVGCGLYGILLFVIITIFIGGLMVGRTPEYLGKKISTYEMKMAAIGILILPLVILVFTAIAVLTEWGRASMGNANTHGFTEILYAFTSMMNNNGSAFAGVNANTPIFNFLGGIVMLIGRYWIMIPVLAIAGSLAQKKITAVSEGTLQSHSPLFIILLVSIIMLIGALSFFPALTLGPIAEQLVLWSQYGY